MTEHTATRAERETLGFQTEVRQLLQLMIHSLYSNREIFLRELISNASDACDKLRFEALHNEALFEDDFELRIRIDYDPAAKTLSITDNGVGMSRDEVITNLGTIAKSGTREFFSQLTGDQQKDAHLIGQFGVGFYSSFIVADKVTVHTRRAGEKPDQGVLWESDGGGEFAIEMAEKPARGTAITLHLREGQDDLLAGFKLRSIIRKYSDHIVQPILMPKEEWKDGKQEKGTEEETVNQASALWARSKNDISDEQYNEFYKHVGHDFDDPLAWTHARVEGRQEYTHLLYIPSRAPFDLWDRNARHGIKLYVRRVFIMDDAEQLLPAYLRFVRGVVDSNDLPLNISREILQESKDIEAIRGGCTRKVLSLLEELAESDKEKYAKFWSAFGNVLKEGIGEDSANRDRIAGLLRFASTQADTADQTVSLADYVARMKEGQDKIYYVTAETFNAAKNSPHLEVFRKKGIEVLLLSDRVDEWVVGHVTEFDGQGAGLGRQGRSRPGHARGRSREEGAGAGRRPSSPDLVATDQGKPRRARQGGPRDASADGVARLPRLRRARHERQSRAPAQGLGPAGAGDEADPRNQSEASGGAAVEGRRQEVRRLGRGAARSGAAGRRRAARRSGHLRQAHQRADAGDERRRVADHPARLSGSITPR